MQCSLGLRSIEAPDYLLWMRISLRVRSLSKYLSRMSLECTCIIPRPSPLSLPSVPTQTRTSVPLLSSFRSTRARQRQIRSRRLPRPSRPPDGETGTGIVLTMGGDLWVELLE